MMTGDTKYLEQGDEMFASSVASAWLSMGKLFSQNYRWSFDYLKWREIAIGSPTKTDKTLPTIKIVSPTILETWTTAADVVVEASDNVGVAGVQFKIGGGNYGPLLTKAPYVMHFDMKNWEPERRLDVTAVAFDASNNYASSKLVYIKSTITSTPRDTVAPTISVSSPSTGTTISGNAVSVTAAASDNVGVVGVQFKVNGQTLGAEDTSALLHLP